jgi:ElaB/YqjD/DUF883 family membrane-anchored ribosome-binding protein
MNNDQKNSVTPQEFLDNLHTLVAEAEALVSDSVTGRSADVIGALRARFDAAQERLAEAYAGARKTVAAGAKYTDDTIRANPYQSLAIALGVGVVLGVFVARRSK